MKVRLDETLFKARAQENLSMTNDINKLEQVDALVECLDHFVADRKWVDEISRDELLTMVTQSNGDKEVLIESVLAKFNTPCIDTKKLKECKERRQNKGLKESMKTRKSLKESDTRDTFTLDTSNTPILDCGLYYTLLGELDPGRYDERFKEFEECVKECAKPILDELVRQTPNFEVVSVGNYHHPRYYNYETDSLEFTVKYTGNDLSTIIEEYSNNQDFIDFLQNYKSYDGFISFYADNKEDFVNQDYAKSVSQIIKYNVTEEEYDEANENLYYDVMDCGFYPEDEDDTEESLKEAKGKKYFYDLTDDEKKEVLNVLTSIADFVNGDKDISTYLYKYNYQSGSTETTPISIWNESGEVSIMLDPEINSAAARKIINKIKKQFDTKELWVYYDKNDGSYPPEIVIKYLDDGKNESKKLKEGTNTSDWDLMRKARNFTKDEVLKALNGVVSTKTYNDIKNDYKIAKLRYLTKSEQEKVAKKLDKKEIKESLKEGYYGQTLQDFLDDCMDYYVIDKIYIYGNDDVVYEGPIDDIPEDMLETEFLECDMYTNRKSVVTVNVDSSEEYGAGTYEFLNEFLDDCNCELVVIYDLAEEEEIFNGYKEDIPEEYLEYAFTSYDAPEELSVNLRDYEGEDDFDESLKEEVSGKAKDFIKELKEFKQFQIDRIKEYNGYDYDDIDIDFGGQDYDGCIDELIDIAQFYDGEFDNLTHTIVGKIQDCVKEKMSIFEIVDYLISDCKSEFDESLKESDDNEVEKLDTFDDQMDFLAKDEQEAIDGYKKVINKVRNTKVKAQLKKIETEEKAHKDYLNKVKKNKDLEYTEPLIERKGNKCCKGKCKKANESLERYHYARVLKKLAGRTITEHNLDACAKEIGINGYRLWNVLKALVDDMYITNGEKYGEEYFKIPLNAYDELPSELKENLKEADNLQTRATKMLSVKKYQIDLAWKNGKTWKTDPMTLDEISKSVGAKVTEKQFVDMMSDNIKGRKDAKNLTKAEIVKLYDYIDGKWKGKDVLWSIRGKTNETLKDGCGNKKTSKRAK